jgi:hypothetical protein
MSTQGPLGFTVWANRLPERAMSDRHGGRSDTAAMNYENLCPLYLPALPFCFQTTLSAWSIVFDVPYFATLLLLSAN